MATTENFFNGDGTTIEFSFSFPYIKTEDVRVELQEIDSTKPINDQIISSTGVILFTIPSNNPTVIQFNSLSAATNFQAITGAPLANHAINTGNTIRIRIYRSTSTTATPATFFSGGAIRSQDLNNNFDSILYITQEKENELTEVIAGGLADGSITSSKLADNAVTTAKIVNDAVTTAKLADDATTASNYTFPGGAQQTVQARLKQYVSVKDFGAVGDGVTDDYAAITLAITTAAGKTLVFPAGTYSVTQTIVFDQSDSVIKGEGEVIITMPNNINREWSVGNIGRSAIGVANGVAPTENVLLEGITFDFNANRRGVASGTGSDKDDAYEKNAFTVANAKNITIRDCRFLNGFRHCLDITTPIKKSLSGLTASQKLLQMPVLPNVGGTEVFGAQYITIENCYFAGGGDDNLTTHYCSNVYITNCRSESPYGGYGTGGGNHNGFEIDDGSRNINITDCTAIKCFSAIEVKAHDYAPAPYNVIIQGLQAINCASSVEIHQSNWDGPVSGNSDNAYNVLLGGSPGTVTLAAGTDQEVVCVDGISPMARNVSVSDIQIIAPTTVNYHTRDSNNVFTPATLVPSRCFEIGGYDGVQVSNILFNDGRSDNALTEDGFADPVVFVGDIGLIHLHDGCRNVSFSNVHVTGFGGSVPLTNRVFEIVNSCFDAINCSNLTVVDGPNQIVEATGASQAYYGIFSGVVARSSVTMAGPALDSSNNNLRFEQPDITGYTETISVQELVLEKSPGTPGDGRGVGSVHVDTNTGVLRTKTTGRDSSDWNSLGALAWARYTGSSDIIRKSNNIEGIVKNSTGDYTVTLSPDLVFASSNDFCCLVTSSQRQNQVTGPTIDGNGKASFTIRLYNDSNTLADSGFMNIVVFGTTVST